MKKVHIYMSLFITIFLSLFLFQKINLLTSDIGRHITSGRLFIEADGLNISRNALLHTNFFSFTHSSFPFVNHHWGSAVLLYLAYSAVGFSGLSFIYGGCIIGATLLLFMLGRNRIPPLYLFPIILLTSPLIVNRTEVRPEGFSYLFIAFVISLLFLYVSRPSPKYGLYVWSIPLICLLWINMHIYFIFGYFILGVFLLERLIRKDIVKAKKIALILGISFCASLINPYGLSGILYPFTIFQNYGYLIVENQSIVFLLNYGRRDPQFLWWFISTIIFLVWSVVLFIKNKGQFPLALFLISGTFAILSFSGIRHFAAYGLVLFATLSEYVYLSYKGKESIKQKNTYISRSVVSSFIILISLFILLNNRMPWNTNVGFGLLPNVLDSAQFIKTQNISGPYFSNYDIGNYIIFNTYPEKVFVDNRPEAYPTSFFKNTYIPMQTDTSVWKKELSKWNFNAIWFYRNDITPWAQQFLITRIKDADWAPVFIDEQTIIFLRRNKQNTPIILKYELPKNMFNVK